MFSATHFTVAVTWRFLDDVALRVRLRTRDVDGGQHRRVPRAEVLGGVLVAELVLQVRRDVGRTDVAPPTAVPVGEQLESAGAPALQPLQQRSQHRILDRERAADASLGSVVEHDGRSVDLHVALADRREPERAMAVRVLLGSDAEHGAVQQPHSDGHGATLGHVGLGEVELHGATDRRQCAREGLDALELLDVLTLPPGGVVQVLAPAGGVGAGGLQVTERVAADPHVLPRRRDRQRGDALQRLGVLHRSTPGVLIGEATATPPAGEAGGRGVGAMESWHRRRIPHRDAQPNGAATGLRTSHARVPGLRRWPCHGLTRPGEREGTTMATLVRHVMTEDTKTLSASMSAADAAGMMANYDIGSVPVLDDDGSLAGIVTDRDIVVRVVAAREDPTQVSLADIVTRAMVEVSPDTEIADANKLMAEHKVRRLPVTKDGALVGIVSLGDLALALASKRAVGETLEEVSTSDNTAARNEGPDAGTPDRVLENREDDGSP